MEEAHDIIFRQLVIGHRKKKRKILRLSACAGAAEGREGTPPMGMRIHRKKEGVVAGRMQKALPEGGRREEEGIRIVAAMVKGGVVCGEREVDSLSFGYSFNLYDTHLHYTHNSSTLTHLFLFYN